MKADVMRGASVVRKQSVPNPPPALLGKVEVVIDADDGTIETYFTRATVAAMAHMGDIEVGVLKRRLHKYQEVLSGFEEA